jgi:hypothetical protein
MAYIGKEPTIGNFQKCDAISVVNGQAAYTLQVGGTNVVPESVNHMLVSLNGILQAPTDSFTVSGSTLTFASNLATGDVIDFVMILGNVLDLGVPSDSTVSLAKLTATGTKDATTFLRGDNTFAAAGGGKVLQVVQTVKTDTFSTTNTYSGGFADITGLSVAITPSATSSKVLVLVQIYNSVSSNTQFFNLIRGSTNLLQPGSGSLKATIANDGNMGNVSITFLDSPSSTSETTYKVATAREASGTVYVNRRQDSDNHTGSSTITAIEIGA